MFVKFNHELRKDSLDTALIMADIFMTPCLERRLLELEVILNNDGVVAKA